jgi:penicillin-binding protein 1A
MNYVEGYAPVYGGTIPAAIWHDFMNGALTHTPIQNFVTPTVATPHTYYTQTQPTYSTTQPSYTTSTTTTTTTSH